VFWPDKNKNTNKNQGHSSIDKLKFYGLPCPEETRKRIRNTYLPRESEQSKTLDHCAVTKLTSL
jgi:hypothetical protein